MKLNRTKPLAIFACAAIATAALAGCGQTGTGYSQSTAEQARPAETSALDSESAIGDERAREIALEHAGLTEDEVTIAHEGRETDYGRLMHEIEFYNGVYEYDYTIDAETGEIVAFDEDAEHYAIADWHRNTPPSTDSGEFIGEDAAKAAALEDADLAAEDVTDMRVALDYDERVPRYEVEFDTGEKSYEYEIYAVDGKIMSFETVRR